MKILDKIAKALLIMGSVACSSTNAASLGEVAAAEAAEMVETKNAVIIDVREQSEWDESHIPGAIHIPLGEVKNRLVELEAYKDQPIVMQCRSGRRSAIAGNLLLEAGFEDVSNLKGGILAWSKDKLPTE